MTDLASLAIEIDSRAVKTGANDLDDLVPAAGRAERAVNSFGNEASQASTKVRTVSQATEDMARKAQAAHAPVAGMSGAFTALAAAISIGAISAVARKFLEVADAAKQLDASLRLATAANGNFAQAQEDVRRVAAATRADLDATAKLYGNFMRNAKELGINQAQASRATESVAKAFKISGAATVEAAQGTRQLVQALQSGVLRGDEFNTIMEAAPRLSKLFADSLGVSVGQLRNMAAEGELTSDRLTKALTDKKFTESLDAEFRQIPVTFSDAMGQVENAAIVTFGAFDRGGQFSTMLSNFVLDGSNGFASLENSATQFGRTVAAEMAGLAAAFQGAAAGVRLIGDAFAWVKSTALGGWIAQVISEVNTLASYLNPLANLLRMIRQVGAAARQAKEQELLAGAQNERINALFGWSGAGGGEMKAEAQATQIATEAKKGHTAASKAQSQALRDAKKAAEDEARAVRDLASALDTSMTNAYSATLAKNAEVLSKAVKQGIADYDAALKAANDNTDAMQKPILDAAKATAEWNESLRRTINYLDQLGGFGSKLGNLGALFEGLRTGDFTSVGGKLGAFAGLFTQTDGGKALVSELRDVLDHTFGGNGQFTKKIDDALKGAGLGLASAQMVFGSGGTNIGAAFGGAIGKAFSKDITKSVTKELGAGLGKIAGAFAPVVGGLLGNLIGGLFSKTKKASATIGLSGDGLGISGLTGNNSTLRSGASSAANSVIEALMNIADQFGAGIGGSISTSIGIRKKSYRVDTTGQGRVQGAGVLDFGEDAQAALKAAIQDAISDGVFTGLSDGVNRLLKGDGDLEAQLKKALSYQGVFDELKQRKDPTGYAMEQVDKWRAGMDKIFAEAGATSDDLAKLEELTGLKRTEILAQANEKALELANDRKQLEIQIMELEGKSTEALAAARELEKAGVDATLRPLYDRIYALQDEAAATAEAAAKAKEIADERLGLEGQLLQVLGDTAEIRARELAALDPSNRAIQQRIWQIEAQQAADEALNAHTKAVLDEQYGLVTQLLNLQGDTNKLRARELAALDPVNRSILEQIFALTDLKAAQDDAAKAAQEAAQVQKAIADERYGLETQLLNLLGDTATIRARELALLDPSNRALQQRIWAITDAQAAEEARVKAMQEAGRAEIKAREDQIASINDTISALSGATERWSGLAKEIREFRAGLFSGTVGSGTSYKQSEAEFQRVSKMAAFGDEGALQSFNGVSKAFLDAARDNARSLVDYQRAIGLVAGAADAAAAGADGVARQAADQIAVLMAQRIELETLNAQTQASLETLNASADVQANNVVPTLEQMVKEQQAASDDASKARAEQKVENLAMVTALNQIARILDRVSQGGESFTVATDGNSLSVTVESSAAAPVHVVTP